jgi:hypothetical protein
VTISRLARQAPEVYPVTIAKTLLFLLSGANRAFWRRQLSAKI